MASVSPILTQISHGVAMRAMPGEAVSGDLAISVTHPGGVLFAALDGVGHGVDAAAAARLAATTLTRFAAEPVEALLQRCHEALRGTRGVAVALAAVARERHVLTWIGVGNVRGVLVPAVRGRRQPELLLQRAGLLGSRLPALRAASAPLEDGDVLALTTDGVREPSPRVLLEQQPAQQVAERVLAESGSLTDDALVLIVQFGREPRR